jgi:hypothetical protein
MLPKQVATLLEQAVVIRLYFYVIKIYSWELIKNQTRLGPTFLIGQFYQPGLPIMKVLPHRFVVSADYLQAK